ncbi:MAG: hypothetical protein HOH88_01775, partial [Flavobacteriales bacterium]|nr:hypothetical protein [Flavobacteriales bacterium]
MKKLLIITGLLIATLSYSQVEDGTIISRYMEIYEYNTYSNKFEKEDSGWVNSMLDFNKDYYMIIVEDGDPSKVYWEFYERDADGQDIYYTETERKFIFNYDSQEIRFYSDYSDYEKIYTKIIVLSKISKY